VNLFYINAQVFWICLSLTLAQFALAGRVTWLQSEGGSGHAYELIVAEGGITWSNASLAATNLGGHLATVASSNENAFIFSVARQDTNAWYGGYGPWLGGYQLPGSVEPGEGWTWVTHEPFTFSNWAAGQPNNNGGEDRLHFGGLANPSSAWNDLGQNATNFARGFVVEYYPPPSVMAISAIVSGSAAPEQVIGAPITNGGFIVTNCCPGRPTGDGKDEFTLWSFDFNREPALEYFLPASELSSALLSLTLTPGSSLVDSDSVRIEPLQGVRPAILRTLPLGVTTNIEVELLDYYAAADVLNLLRAQNGTLPMTYQEDAVVSFAQLVLTQPNLHVRLQVRANGFVQICWNSELNKKYALQYRTNLSAATGAWLNVGSTIFGNGTTNCILAASASPARFYRLMRVPQP